MTILREAKYHLYGKPKLKGKILIIPTMNAILETLTTHSPEIIRLKLQTKFLEKFSIPIFFTTFGSNGLTAGYNVIFHVKN